MKQDNLPVKVKEDKKKLREVAPLAITGYIVMSLIIPLLINLAAIFVTLITFQASSKLDKERGKKLKSILKTRKGWRVYIIKREKEPNACAIVGQHVFLTEGIVKLLNEDELIAVMLHEAGHIQNKDIWKTVIGGNIFASALLAAIGVLTGTFAVMACANAFYFVLISTTLGEMLFRRIIGRFHENRADSWAVKYGYGKPMASALRKLDIYMKKQIGKCEGICKIIVKVNETMDEHPPIRKRIEKILQDEKTWRVLQSKSFVKIRDYFMKQFNVSKEDLEKKGMDTKKLAQIR